MLRQKIVQPLSFLGLILITIAGCTAPATPTLKSTGPLLSNGTDEWQLSAVSFQDTLDQNGKAVMPSDESQTFLRVDFECTSGASLVNLYTGSKVQSSGFGVPGGIPDVYVTDSTATRYLAILIENCSVVVPVSKSSKGFKLYFKDLLPIKLGK